MVFRLTQVVIHTTPPMKTTTGVALRLIITMLTVTITPGEVIPAGTGTTMILVVLFIIMTSLKRKKTSGTNELKTSDRSLKTKACK